MTCDDGRGVAALLERDPSSQALWSRDDLAAILRHELAQPVSSDNTRTCADLLGDAHPLVEALDSMRQKQGKRRHDPDSALPPEVPTALYYAAVTAARVRAGIPCGDLSLGQWQQGLRWLLRQDWVEGLLRGLYLEGVDSRWEASGEAPQSPLPDVTCADVIGRRGPAPRRVGNYVIREQLGEGGMGIVYVAEQESPRRTVALKVMRPSLLSTRAMRRFEHEAEVLGRLQHPNIAQVYEAGTFDAGSGPQPFFAMELIRGKPITVDAVRRKSDLRVRLELMSKVCDAVHYAHQRGVVHRDLKPANILVDGDGEPKVVDFGVARVADAEVLLSLDTSPGNLVGTLQYMAPEQAAGDGGDVDTRADVYALGVILYEMLAGRPPYDLQGRALTEAVRVIREQEPTPLARVDRRFRGDVATIVAKAVAKEPARRYAGASHLASDLRRYLDHQPIAARTPGAAYTLRKFARRHRTLVTAAAAILMCLVAGVVGTASQARRAVAAEREGREKLRGSLLNEARAERYGGRPGRRFNALRALSEAARIRPDADLRDEAIAALPLVDVTPQHSLPHGVHWPSVIAFDPAMRHYVVGGNDRGDLYLRRASDGARVRTFSTPGPAAAWVVVFSADGKRLAAKYHPAGPPEVSRLRVWDVESGDPLMDMPEMRGDLPFDFMPDGRSLAVGDEDGSVRLVDSTTGREFRRLPPGLRGFTLRFSPSGRHLAVGGVSDRDVEVREVVTGDVTMRVGTGGGVRCVAWSPSGDLVAAAGDDLLVHVWEFPSGRTHAVLKGHTHVPTDVRFSAGGSLLASCGWDSQLRLWQTMTGRPVLAILDARMFGDGAVRFGPDDAILGYSADRSRVTLYALASGRERLTIALRPEERRGFHSADVSPDNRRIVVANGEDVRIYDRASGAQLAELPIGPQGMAAFEAAGRSVVTWGKGGLRRWPLVEPAGRAETAVTAGPPTVLAVPPPADAAAGSLSHDGTLAALTDFAGGRVHLYDLRRNELVSTTAFAFAGFAAVHPDGPRIAVTSRLSDDPKLTVWDVGGGKRVYERSFPNGASATFSGDGQRLVAGSADWNLAVRLPAGVVEHKEWISSNGGVAYHPAAEVVAFSAGQGLVRLLRLSDGRVLASIPGGKPVGFSRDGGLLLTHDGDLHVWDLDLIGRQLAEMRLPLELPGHAADAVGRPTSPAHGHD
jgi:WD40 repeat protein